LNAQEKQLITINELAELTMTAPQTWRNRAALRKIPFSYYKIGSSVRFDKNEILNWLETLRHSATGKI
jgi:predicted DNA-binding transcriptional regulator AlpA